VHRATGRGGLLLQAVEQPERFGHLRATVEHIAGHHQRGGAQRPVVVVVDDMMSAQQLHQQAVLAVDVRHRHDARRGRVLRGSGLLWRSHRQRMRVAAFGQHHGAAAARRQVALDHVVIADPLRLVALGGHEHVGAIGIHMFGRRGNLAGGGKQGNQDKPGQDQAGGSGTDTKRHRRLPAERGGRQDAAHPILPGVSSTGHAPLVSPMCAM